MKQFTFLLALTLVAVASVAARAEQKPTEQKPAAGPIIVLDTVRGVIEIETYPSEAPKTVAHVVGLIKKGFYNGQRFHRVVPGFVAQIGDPQTRDMTKMAYWGQGNSGTAVGVSEFSKKLKHGPGMVGMAHATTAKDATSQFYITFRAAPNLDGKHAIFGRVIKGMDVAAKIQKSDVLKKASVRE